jgi:ABC-2 type transport system ATP-binding protein
MNNGKAAITIDNLKKSFGDVHAVNGLDLEIKEGELFGLLGPNGAGKTTAINIMVGLQDPTDGSVNVAGFDITKQPKKVHERIGMCPQEMAVFPFLTGRENVEFYGGLHAMSKHDIKKSVSEFLDKVNLSEDADRKVKEYSGGMKRRISLISALIFDPDIAFLDEPSVGLDPASRRAVWDFIKGLKKENKTIILTTHYMEEAEYLCDRIGIIEKGNLIALGTPEDLMKENNAKNLEEVFLKLTGHGLRDGE